MLPIYEVYFFYVTETFSYEHGDRGSIFLLDHIQHHLPCYLPCQLKGQGKLNSRNENKTPVSKNEIKRMSPEKHTFVVYLLILYIFEGQCFIKYFI